MHGQLYCLFFEILFGFYTDTPLALLISCHLVHILQERFQRKWYVHNVGT